MPWNTPSTRSTGDLITAAIWNTDVVGNLTALIPITVAYKIDGGGAVISTGVKGYVRVNMKFTITSASIIADQVGDIVIDVWKVAYSADTLPADSDSITASAPPTISCKLASTDATLTGWSKEVAAGDVFGFNVDSVAVITFCTLCIGGNRS